MKDDLKQKCLDLISLLDEESQIEKNFLHNNTLPISDLKRLKYIQQSKINFLLLAENNAEIPQSIIDAAYKSIVDTTNFMITIDKNNRN